MAGTRALVIGGTGPTGPFVVEGLVARGYQVTIMHSGQHEVDFRVGPVAHIHDDPHFKETLERGLGDQTFDLTVAQYGRLRVISDVLVGRTGRVIGIGAATAMYGTEHDLRWGGFGKPAIVPDNSDVLINSPDENKLAFRMAEAMQGLLDHHAAGDYSATYLGYPNNYGPRQPGPLEWPIVRRALDGRKQMVVADGGIKLESRIHTENAARAILLVIDNPDIAAGKRYSVTEDSIYTMRQRIEFIANHLGVEFELIDMPYDIAWPCHPLWRHRRGHQLCASDLIRSELGYKDHIPAEVGMVRTIDWLLSNRPVPGGELERQLGDPFAYAAEDDLITTWRAAVSQFADTESPLPGEAHFYRHPKTPNEQWLRPSEQGARIGNR
jgi:nucleoside-diphosphate-sugar epimerase